MPFADGLASKLSEIRSEMTTASAPPTAPTAATGGFSEAQFEAFLKTRDEPRWLLDRRRAAFEALARLPMPTLRDEEWRRTDIRGLKLGSYAVPAAGEVAAADRQAVAKSWEALAAHYATGLERINGQPTRAADPAKLGGAVLLDLAEAARVHPEVVRKYLLTDAVSPTADAFAALHAAFWTGGAFLYVPAGVKVEAPLYSLIAMTGAGRVDLEHTLVVLEEGAEATLVRECTSIGRGPESALHVGAVELFVAQGAKLQFVNLQNWDEQTWNFSRERALVGADAAVQWTVGGIGSRLSKVNQEVALVGEGADAQVNGVMFTTGRQHLAYFTRQDHAAPNTRSDLLYKAGLKDTSRIVWKGMIRVEKDAQKTDAYQKDDNLILSHEARTDSIPGLEIEANDVRCTHGATAGQVDPEMIFYAQARGVEKATAVRLIVEGFFANVYDRIALEPVRETLRQAVATKLQLGTGLDQIV